VPLAIGFGIVFGEADPPFPKRAKVEREADLSEFHPPAARIALKVPPFEGLTLVIIWILIDEKNAASPVIQPSIFVNLTSNRL